MIEALKISNSPSYPVNSQNSRPTTLLDLQDAKNKNDIGKTSDKQDELANKKNDYIELSPEAQILLNQQEVNNTTETTDQARRDLKDNALEFRGLFETSKRRDLTSNEETKLSSLRDNINRAFEVNKDVSAEDILRLANKTLSEFQTEASDILNKFNNGNVTNTDFAKLDKINRNLNKANGFVSEPSGIIQQKQLDELNKGFTQILDLPKQRQLTRQETGLLEQIQAQISSIEGFRLNVKQSIGIDGVRA